MFQTITFSGDISTPIKILFYLLEVSTFPFYCLLSASFLSSQGSESEGELTVAQGQQLFTQDVRVTVMEGGGDRTAPFPTSSPLHVTLE